jgi:hypothetical protein
LAGTISIEFLGYFVPRFNGLLAAKERKEFVTIHNMQCKSGILPLQSGKYG